MPAIREYYMNLLIDDIYAFFSDRQVMKEFKAWQEANKSEQDNKITESRWLDEN